MEVENYLVYKVHDNKSKYMVFNKELPSPKQILTSINNTLIHIILSVLLYIQVPHNGHVRLKDVIKLDIK
jgi:hypothetical protein